MDNIDIKFNTTGKALPPRPIRMNVPGWGGSADYKMENGSEPQPWHCPPFVEGATYGFELLYHYDTECRVVNDNPNADVRFDWNYAAEPGGVSGADEFGVFAPTPSKFYFFATLIDIQVPPGYVVRTQPHPRFFTDTTGACPAAVVGHVQTSWWPKKLFVVFKAPAFGETHIFRKGEPYVQLLVVPQRPEYTLTPMTEQEASARREAERKIVQARSFIARNLWQNAGGSEFNDHYRTLMRSYQSGGVEEMNATINQGVQYLGEILPQGRSLPEYLDLAQRYQREGKLIEAREALYYARRMDFNNAEVVSRLGILAGLMNNPMLSMKMMQQATLMRPQNAAYRNNLGIALRKIGKLADAEAALRASISLNPNDPLALSNLGIVVAEQGRMDEGLTLCEAAAASEPNSAPLQYRVGTMLAQVGRKEEAVNTFNAALKLDPNYAPATEALKKLEGSGA